MAQYLVEERVLRPAPEIKSTQVISLTEAAKRLGVSYVSYPTLYNYFSASARTAILEEAIKEGTAIEGELDDDEQSLT